MGQEESAWLAIHVNVGHDRLHLSQCLGPGACWSVILTKPALVTKICLVLNKTKQKQKQPWKVIEADT